MIIDPAATAPATPKRRRSLVTVAAWVLLVPGLIWAVIRLFGLERGGRIPFRAVTTVR